MAKNLLICFDGTWNKEDGEGDEASNVWRLFQLATGTEDAGDTGAHETNRAPQLGQVYEEGKGSSSGYDTPQITWYDAGVGTNWYERFRGGLFGYGLDENIMQGYAALAELYEEGDSIFLCGFSRGAYTARSLAGLMAMCGLVDRDKVRAELGASELEKSDKDTLHTSMQKLCQTALELYRDADAPNTENPVVQNEAQKRAAFCAQYTRPVPIECIAVWDTVKALGLPTALVKYLPFGLGERYNEARYGFHDASLSPIVRHGYHALALDEHREDFAPVLWTNIKEDINSNAEYKNSLDSQKDKKNNVSISDRTAMDRERPNLLTDGIPPQKQTIEQRWFCGAHSDVGGGYASRALSDQSLMWMCEKLRACGLLLQDEALLQKDTCSHSLPSSPPYLAPITDSFRDFYRLTYPLQSRYIRPVYAENHTVQLDPSVIQRMVFDASYRPKNAGLADLLGFTIEACA